MKKLLLMVLAILLLGLQANSQQIINYYGGRPISMTTIGNGYMRTTPIVNGNTINASTTFSRPYARPYTTGVHNRGYARPRRPLPPPGMGYRNYYNNGYYPYYAQPRVVTTTTTKNTETKKMSRLNKDYKRPQRSSYTRNGVTYYN